MSSPLSLYMFCNNASFSAGTPRKPSANLSFSLAPKSDHVDDTNAAIFPDQAQRGANLNLNGVSKELLAQFAEAPRVKVTIEILP